MKTAKEGIGEKFHEQTKHKRGDTFPSGKRVPAFKVYASPLETVRLATAKIKGGSGLWNVLAARRSQVPELGASITPAELSQLLWAAQGVTQAGRGSALPLRAAPSMSGSFPLETYVLSRNVADTFAGVYHFVVREQSLEQVRIGDFTKEFIGAMIGNDALETSACAIVLTGVVERVTATHGERGYRYLYLEAGMAAENILLAATALGLSAQTITGFYDEELAYALGLSGNREMPVLVIVIGR